MSQVIDIREGKKNILVKRAYRNLAYKFKENFDAKTRLSDVSPRVLLFLAQGKGNSMFYIYDLIMNLLKMGSGFEFNELNSPHKMEVIDRSLFILDMVRYECMKRLEWLESYPGEEIALVDLVLEFNRIAPAVKSEVPRLSPGHKDYDEYNTLPPFEKEVFIRKLIPDALHSFNAYVSYLARE